MPPEEAQLKQRIASAVEAMERNASGLSGSGRASSTECRFKARVTVRLSEAGPGPAAGGPVYFRIDAWSLCASSLFGRPSQPELFARAFVPINDSKYHRRACTWPMIDAAGNDVAYVTCEFSFARIPSPVQDLHVDVMANDVRLAWLPPANEDKAVPLKGYRVDSRLLGRGKRPSGGASTWLHAGDVEAREARENSFLASGLKPDSLYIFRVCAVNEVGLGEPEELEVQTGPCAPAGCGQPRLAGCSGPVLAVEWDPPMYDGGANLVAYRLWVRPFSVTDADPHEWLEIGHVKHIADSVQRAEIHTEEFDQRIGRRLMAFSMMFCHFWLSCFSTEGIVTVPRWLTIVLCSGQYAHLCKLFAPPLPNSVVIHSTLWCDAHFLVKFEITQSRSRPFLRDAILRKCPLRPCGGKVKSTMPLAPLGPWQGNGNEWSR